LPLLAPVKSTGAAGKSTGCLFTARAKVAILPLLLPLRCGRQKQRLPLNGCEKRLLFCLPFCLSFCLCVARAKAKVAFDRLRAKVASFASLAFDRLRAKVALRQSKAKVRQSKAKVLQAKAKVAFSRLRAKVEMQ